MSTTKKILFWLIVLTYSATCFAGSGLKTINQEKNPDPDNHIAFNLSVFYPLSINKNDDVSTNVNLSWLYGKVGSVSGIELSGCVNQVKRDVQGFESAGILNYVSGKMEGFQSAGVANHIGNTMQGFQTAGVYNHVKGDVTFFQSAGIVNHVEGDFEGVQVAGIVNDLRGNLSGLQTSTVNIAGNVDEVQISVVNIAKRVNGVQIGVVNIAKKIDGIPIGLVNYAEDGKIHPVLWSSNIFLGNFGVKFAVNDYFYSILSLSNNNQLNDVSKSIAVGYTMGLHFSLQDKLFIDCDLGGYSVDNEKLFKVDEGVKNQNMLQARLIVGYKLFEKLSIFGGVGQNYALDHDQHIDDGEYETLFLAGLQLF